MHPLSNYQQLATTESRRLILDAFIHALSQTDPALLMKQVIRAVGNDYEIKTVRGVRTIKREKYRRVVLLGAGKAVAKMASALPFTIDEGVLIVPRGVSRQSLPHVEIVEADYPLATLDNVRASQRLLDVALNVNDDDLVICLFSGGASALLSFPAVGIELAQKQALIEDLMHLGAERREINVVRKHLSRVKGGLLAKELQPNTVITFLLSDIIDNHLDLVGSGPTVPDTSTFGEALEILKYYKLTEKYPSIADYFVRGTRGEIPETPKENDPCFHNTHVCLIGDNTRAVEAAHAYLTEKKIRALEYVLAGNVVSVAKRITEMFDQGQSFVAGGDITVVVKGKGKGGRNQELCLRLLEELKHKPYRFTFAAFSTDGIDGSTAAAGAIIDETTLALAAKKKLSPHHFLETSNSGKFFELLGQQILTGPIENAVADIAIGIVHHADIEPDKHRAHRRERKENDQ